jgi:hypothetical protein
MHNTDQAACEALLKGLVPAPVRIDRDRLMFRAGREAGRWRGWAWPCAAAVLAVASAGLGAALWMRPATRTVERTVYVEVRVPAPHRPDAPTVTPAAPPKPQPVAEAGERPGESPSYLHLRGQVLRWGVDALPEPRPLSTSRPPWAPAGAPDVPAPTFDGTRMFQNRKVSKSGDVL